ncbi:MAG TPA: penicillin-binding transpeptidase domain-containing protein [Clostridiales bacterium]|nr:penicillin-binding transpeptidase domain-containing protein [Clostridiales bacterium]
MNYTTRRAYVVLALIGGFFAGMIIMTFSLFKNGGHWASNRVNAHLYSGGQIVNAGSVFTADGEELAKSFNGKRVYSKDRTLRLSSLHVLGDPVGFIASGTHSLYREELFGYSFVNGIYTLKEYGKGNDVYLTINSKANKAAYNALNGRKGAVGVYNFKTGEIICAVSNPAYDLNNKPKDMKVEEGDTYEGVYLNRLFSGLYTPGSIFKTVTAACAIENTPALSSWTFTCTGEYQVGQGLVKCPKKHGKMDFEKALNNSCNCAFAQLAIDLGKEKLDLQAQSLGFGQAIKIDKTLSEKSILNLDRANGFDLAWAASGQYTTLVNPAHMMILMGAIANGGQAVSPYFVEKIVTPNKIVIYRATKAIENSVNIKPETANELAKLFRSNVINEYGDSSFPKLQMCGKTGTAEVQKGKAPHAWFVGFSQRDDLPYAIVVVVENAGSAISNAVPVANRVMQALK